MILVILLRAFDSAYENVIRFLINCVRQPFGKCYHTWINCDAVILHLLYMDFRQMEKTQRASRSPDSVVWQLLERRTVHRPSRGHVQANLP